MTDDPKVPLNSRGTPRTRFNPLRDEPGAKNGDFDAPEGFLAEFELENGPEDEREPFTAPRSLISAVRRHIASLGLSESVEGAMAITAATKAADSSGSAAAACLHELRMVMAEIRAQSPASATVQDGTEDLLSRRRRERGA